MPKLTTTDLTSLANETSAMASINNNFAAVETAMEKTLSRDGTSPNAMEADLDMNSNQILNLPDPNTAQEPATKNYVDNLVGVSPGFLPVINPSSGNIQGSGFPTTHQLIWADSNPIFNADAMYFTSSDPSALCSITVSNAGSAGNVVSLRWRWGSNDVTVSYTVQTGNTTTQVAAGLVAAIKANSSLYTPANGTTNISGGGYQNGALIGYITNSGNVIHLDYDSRQTVTLDKTVTGSVNVTLPQTHPTALDKAWDSNPLSFWVRNVSGMAPPANSNVWNLVIGGANSSGPGTINTQYGNAGVQVINSTAGSISSRWQFYTPDANGVINQGIHIGAGISGASVTGGDKGPNTANFSALYLSNRNILSRDTAAYTKSTNQSVTTLNAFVPVTFNTAQVASSSYNTSTSQYTVANSGLYDIQSNVDIVVGGTATFVAICLRKNGSVITQVNREASASGINYTLNLRDIVSLSAGDVLDIVVYTTQSITLTGGAPFTRFLVNELTR